MFASLLAVMKKELRQALRDPRMAAMLVVAPVLQLTLLGFAVDLDVDRVPAIAVDLDQSEASRALLRVLFASEVLVGTASTLDPSDIDDALIHGRAQVGILIERGFERDLKASAPAHAQVAVDGSDPIAAQVAISFAELAASQLAARIARERAAERRAMSPIPISLPGITEVRARIYYNPQLKSTVYMVPGVAATVLLIVTTIVTAMGIARERELGTIEQLLVTPMRPSTLLLGKTIPFAGIGLVVAGLVISAGTNVFDVPLRGSLVALFLGTLCYLMCTLGAGILISTIARTQQQAILAGIFFLMPAILLSGFMSPIDNMPAIIRGITWLNPVRHYVFILRAILVRGAGLEHLATPLFALSAFGAGALWIASMRFRMRLEA